MSEVPRCQPQTMHFYSEYLHPAAERHSERFDFNTPVIEHKPSPEVSQRSITNEKTAEKEEKETKGSGMLARLMSCVRNRKKKSSVPSNRLRKRNWLYIIIAVVLALMVVAATVAATQITRKGDGTPTQQQWLNLTGYPPMPTRDIYHRQARQCPFQLAVCRACKSMVMCCSERESI